jgi:hypothetical protein
MIMDYGDVREQSAGDLYPYVIVAQEGPKGLQWYWQLGEFSGSRFPTQREAEESARIHKEWWWAL